MTNMFSHQKIVYHDLGPAKLLKIHTGTTEKYLIINSMSEWINMLVYEQEISNAVCGGGWLNSMACTIAQVRIQLWTKCFCKGLPPDN